MSTHKSIDRICVIVLAFALLVTALFINGEALGLQRAEASIGYESRLFDTSRVHTVDIIIDDWDSFLQTCQSEEYSPCNVVIDGETYRSVGIRGKGNTSLSTVASMNSSRYSFKLEFDHYDSSKSYHGLDKLSLNNTIQDTTYMKDYLTYELMRQFGVAAPLCSYVYITVNGEDWGLYLAVEAIEESFLQRNYGSDYGELYKPDSLSFGGGRGNGMEFSMDSFLSGVFDGSGTDKSRRADNAPASGGGFDPGSFDPGSFAFGGGGMGSSDVKLQYIDDDPDSYSNIFSSAKTDVTDADRSRLIQSLKTLSSGQGVEDVLDIDQLLRYFVVHNFVVNGDSYTGSMIHNYYLYEKDGQLTMLPWDYNLAFGTFQGNDATSAVNDPIDTPLSVTGSGDRPIVDWIFSDEEYTRLYHQYFAEFLAQTDPAALIDATAALISPYVEKDPTAFYSYEEFEAGTAALREFCRLRVQSIEGQLSGAIPTTDQGQSDDPSALVDASHLSLSAMGTMGGTGGSPDQMGGFQNPMGGFPGEAEKQPADTADPGGFPGGSDNFPDDVSEPPDGRGDFPDGMGSLPDGMGSFPDNIENLPDGMGDHFGGGASTPPGADGSSTDFFGTAPAARNSGLWLLLASVVVLLLGILFAWKFKR